MAAKGPARFDVRSMEFPVKLRALRLISAKLVEKLDDEGRNRLCEDGVMRESGQQNRVEGLLEAISSGTISHIDEMVNVTTESGTAALSTHDMMGAFKAVCRSLQLDERIIHAHELAELRDVLRSSWEASDLADAIHKSMVHILQMHAPKDLQTLQPDQAQIFTHFSALQILYQISQKVHRRAKLNRMSKENVSLVLGPILCEMFGLYEGLLDTQMTARQAEANTAALKLLDKDFDLGVDNESTRTLSSHDGDVGFEGIRELREATRRQQEQEQRLQKLTERPPRRQRHRSLSLAFRRKKRIELTGGGETLVQEWKHAQENATGAAGRALSDEALAVDRSLLGKSIGPDSSIVAQYREIRRQQREALLAEKAAAAAEQDEDSLSTSSELSSSSASGSFDVELVSSDDDTKEKHDRPR